jgi:hypothetical protein
MKFRSNYLSVKWSFSEKDHGKMKFRSNEFSAKRPCAQFFFGQMTFFVGSIFDEMTIFWRKKSVKWALGQTARHSVKRRFGRMNFQSNGIRSNGVWSIVFRSNGLSVKKFRWNDFPVKWSRTRNDYEQFGKSDWLIDEFESWLVLFIVFFRGP